jgi:hypothetical protein
MKRQIAASLSSLLWGLFAYLGYYLVAGVTQQHVAGYPSAAQQHYYVHFPILMLLVSLGLLLLARKLPLVPFVAIWMLQIVVLIPFFLGYTGGV